MEASADVWRKNDGGVFSKMTFVSMNLRVIGQKKDQHEKLLQRVFPEMTAAQKGPA